MKLTDPDGNQTTWQYNGLGEVTAETNALDASDYYYYDGTGELSEKIDADGRATVYAYDGIGRETSEKWYTTADTSGTPTETISYTYNAAGLLESATDQVTGSSPATDSYTYDDAGEVASETEVIPGLAPTVTLSSQYAAGNRTQLAASIGGVNDFVNNYQYNSVLGEMSRVTQESNGGDAVAAKTATFAYNNLGQFTTVNRYQNADATANLVAAGTYTYNSAGELTSIDYADANQNTLDNFSWTYDALGDVATSSSTLDGPDGTVTYTNDSTGQLTGASGGQAASESYVYDANGNRETVTTSGNQVTCVTGPNNELLYDGTYTYSYDADGNQTARWIASTTSPLETQPGAGDTDITIYTWDNRDRLTSVTHYADYDAYSGTGASAAPRRT